MVIGKRKAISLKVDPLFFDNVFEKERRKLENKIKLSSGMDKRLSQIDFTRIIAVNKMRMNKDLFKLDLKNEFKRRKKR